MSHENRKRKPHIFRRRGLLSRSDENMVCDFLEVWEYANRICILSWSYNPSGALVKWTDAAGNEHSIGLGEMKKGMG